MCWSTGVWTTRRSSVPPRSIWPARKGTCTLWSTSWTTAGLTSTSGPTTAWPACMPLLTWATKLWCCGWSVENLNSWPSVSGCFVSPYFDPFWWTLIRWRALMSACPARTETERLLCTLLPAEGTIVSWRGCCTWVQRSSRTTGEAPRCMMLQRMESWRLDATFVL